MAMGFLSFWIVFFRTVLPENQKTYILTTVFFAYYTVLAYTIQYNLVLFGMEVILSVWMVRRQKKQSLVEQMRAIE